MPDESTSRRYDGSRLQPVVGEFAADWDFAVNRKSLSVEVPGAVLWSERHVSALAIIGTLLVIASGSIVMTLLQGPAR